jgi:hypothetical protein
MKRLCIALLFLTACGSNVVMHPPAVMPAPDPHQSIYHQATVTWTPVDGVAGYYLYYGTQVVSYQGSASTSTSLTLPSGTYEFYVTSYDIYGNESDPSPSVEVTF